MVEKEVLPVGEPRNWTPPEYVELDGVALRYRERGDYYWRNAGLWRVDYRIEDGKFISWCPNRGTPWLHRVELKEITEQEWREDNKGYV